MRHLAPLPLLALAALLLSLAGPWATVAAEPDGDKVFGTVRGRVLNDEDPLGQFRLQVERQTGAGWIDAGWAEVVRPMVDEASFQLPEVGDEVLLIFERGDRERPLVLGVL